MMSCTKGGRESSEKVIFNDKGGGGVRQKMIFHDKGPIG